MKECQICNVPSGKHKIEIQGLCGDHAEQLRELLNWWAKHKKKASSVREQEK